MSTALDLLYFKVSFAIPSAHLLLVVMGVGSWGCPMLESVSQSVSVSFVLWKNALSLSSVADNRTFFVMEERA